MAIWINPKTDWTIDDRFNIEDYNRIKNNLNYLHRKSEDIYGEYAIEDMGADVISHAGFWDVDTFNKFESNLETINAHMINADIGLKQTFYPNGVFIGHAELNRLENAILTLKAVIDGWYEAMPVLSFRLGGQKLGSDRVLRVDIPVSLSADATNVATQRVNTPLDLTGLVVTATYRSGETADVTAGCVFEPAIGTILTETGTQAISVSYTEEGETVTDSFNVTVIMNIPSWADATDAQIEQLLQMHYNGDINLHDYWNVGDKRTVHMSAIEATSDFPAINEQDITITLANKGGKNIKGSGTTYDTDCAFVTVQETGFFMRAVPVNGDPTPVQFASLINWLADKYYNALPATFRTLYKDHKISVYFHDSGEQYYYKPFAIASEKEMTGTNTIGRPEESQSQFEYYIDPLHLEQPNQYGTFNSTIARTIRSGYPNQLCTIKPMANGTTPETYSYYHNYTNATQENRIKPYGTI